MRKNRRPHTTLYLSIHALIMRLPLDPILHVVPVHQVEGILDVFQRAPQAQLRPQVRHLPLVPALVDQLREAGNGLFCPCQGEFHTVVVVVLKGVSKISDAL